MQKWQITLLIGLVAGFLVFGLMRFATFQDEHTHYHANFAFYINGQRDEFKDDKFYEDVAACNVSDGMSPRERVHLHNHDNNLVHVHDDGVTWGQLFENLGYSIGNQYLSNGQTTFVSNDHRKVSFVLDGEPVSDVANRQIHKNEKLLVSYVSNDPNELNRQYQTVETSASNADESADPGACGAQADHGWRARWHHIWE